MSPATHHHADHEALIRSFETEGWSRKDAEYRAATFRRAFVPGTPYAELLRRREADLAYQAEKRDGWYPASLAPVAAQVSRAA